MSMITDILQGIPVNAVLRERITILEQKFKELEEANKALEEEKATLVKEKGELQSVLDEARRAYPPNRPKTQWGCYVFEGDQNLYCPACYDSQGKKYLTTRLSSKLRRCSFCRTELGS